VVIVQGIVVLLVAALSEQKNSKSIKSVHDDIAFGSHVGLFLLPPCRSLFE